MTTVSNTKAFCLNRNTSYKELLFQSWLLLSVGGYGKEFQDVYRAWLCRSTWLTERCTLPVHERMTHRGSDPEWGISQLFLSLTAAAWKQDKFYRPSQIHWVLPVEVLYHKPFRDYALQLGYEIPEHCFNLTDIIELWNN